MIPALDVYDASPRSNDPEDCVLVARARFHARHQRISTTFTYDDSYLALTEAYAIDPLFPLMPGPQHCDGLPGSFRDSAPDRWGRHLIDRSRRFNSEDAHTPLRSLDDVDYLVGVFDQTREGSLRFRKPGGAFLAQKPTPIPPVIELPQLLHASNELACDASGHDSVKALLDAGSGSLGGARPKASVRDGSKLLLAKFSHPHDEWNVMAWEKTMLDMAKDAGIETPASKLLRIGDQSVLLLERFDRQDSLIEGRRIPYLSAMTMLAAADGETRDYVELAEALPSLSGQPSTQLKQLFYRVLFMIAVGNTDDHMRNWAFLRTRGDWRFSPLFDVNPNPYENAQRVTTIGGYGSGDITEGLRELALYAGLDDGEVATMVGSTIAIVRDWRGYARKNGCIDQEIKLFAPMFDRQLALLPS